MLNRPHSTFPEKRREDLLHDLTAGKHVRHATRHAEVVLKNDEPAIRKTDQVGSNYADVHIARHLDAPHLPSEMLASIDDFAWDDTVFQNALLVVDVLQKIGSER